MDSLFAIAGYAAILGASSGIAPGPMLTLTISESLQYSWRAGFKVALTPLGTDTVIILLLWPLIHWVAKLDVFFGLLSIGGAFFLFYLAYTGWQAKPPAVDQQPPAPKTFRKAVTANVFNPAPYLFWSTVGIPLMLRSHTLNSVGPLLVYGVFFGLFVGIKCTIALMVDRLRHGLNGLAYSLINRALALALAAFGLRLLVDGAHYLDW